MRIKLSLLDRKYGFKLVDDIQEGQWIPQYHYVSDGSTHVNKKDEDGMIDGLTTVIVVGHCLTLTSIPVKCCC